jgi:hypothetical protein
MRLLKETFGILVALVIVAVIVAFVAPNRARAVAATLVQIVPGTTTHVGQHESQLVSLGCLDEGKAYCSEIDAEGKGVDDSIPYVVPKGYTLIVTDYNWRGFNSQSGNLIIDYLYNPAVKSSVFNDVEAESDENRLAIGYQHYTTGFRVGSGVTLADALATTSTGYSFVQGYLVPND